MNIIIDQSAIKRIKELRKQKSEPELCLRVRVEGGGCSGFQYKLELVTTRKSSDLYFDDAIITDEISLGFLDGARIFFENSLIGSEFKIDNPNAKSGCGCGTSFAI